MDKLVSINIAGWLACLLFVIGLANGLLKLRRYLIGEPPAPSNPELGLTQRDLRERVVTLEENVEAVRAQTAREREADRISATTRSAGIYKKIDEVSERMTVKVDAVERRLTDAQQSMERRLMDKHEALPEKILTLFENLARHRTHGP